MRYKDKKNSAGLKTNPAGHFLLYSSSDKNIFICFYTCFRSNSDNRR